MPRFVLSDPDGSVRDTVDADSPADAVARYTVGSIRNGSTVVSDRRELLGRWTANEWSQMQGAFMSRHSVLVIEPGDEQCGT